MKTISILLLLTSFNTSHADDWKTKLQTECAKLLNSPENAKKALEIINDVQNNAGSLSEVELDQKIDLLIGLAKMNPDIQQKLTPEMIDLFLKPKLKEALLAKAQLAHQYGDQNYWANISAKMNEALSELNIDQSNLSTVVEKLTEKLGVVVTRLPADTQIIGENDSPLQKRIQLIERETQSITLATWGIYNDVEGHRLMDALEEKAKTIPVRVLVDNITSQGQHFYKMRARMEALDKLYPNFQLTLWKSLDQHLQFEGFHSKFMLFESTHTVVMGGRNPGTAYFGETNGENTQPHWRDTDIQFTSPILYQQLQTLYRRHMSGSNSPTSTLKIPVDQSSMAAIIAHDPGQTNSILLATLALIKSARKEILIENAYILNFPLILDALVAAQKNNISVKLFTNSMSSIDEPLLTRPLVRSINSLLSAGAQVYIKNGKETLHSKDIVIDQQAGWIGSYNMHPRSELFEHEVVLLFNNAPFAKKLHTHISDGIKNYSTRITSPINLPEDPMSDFLIELGYDHL